MKMVITSALVITFCFLLNSCNTTEPPDNNNDKDTTSHNFTFQTWTFGEHSSSVLYDVAIIDENNIFAVGEIYMNDSLGQSDPQLYGVAHWDGTDWRLAKVPYHDFNQTEKYPGPLFSIAIIEGEIYVGSYANLLKWTGNDWEEKAFFLEQIPFDGQVIKIWGYNENNIYCVGRNGAIYYYFGISWQKIESGTDLNIYDIWGDYNSTNGAYEIIAVAAKEFVTYDKKIFRITGNSVQNISTDSIPYSIHGVWFKSGKKYFISGDGLYSKNNINSISQWEWVHPNVTNYYLYAIRGQDTNALFACGAFGEIIHYNGRSWKSFIQETGINGTLNNIDFKKNLVVAVGYASPKAVITIGLR